MNHYKKLSKKNKNILQVKADILMQGLIQLEKKLKEILVKIKRVRITLIKFVI